MSRDTGLAEERLRELAQAHPEAVDLARYASLATRVDAALLRRLRLDLLPGSNAGTEADLWFSNLSESRDSESWVLDPDVGTLLQQRLATEQLIDGRRALEVAFAHTRAAHAKWPASLVLEERLTYLALRGGADAAEEIGESLRPAMAAMASGEQRGIEIARWVLRAMPRLPQQVRQSTEAVALMVAAIAKIGSTPGVLAKCDIAGVPLDLGWLLPPTAFALRTELLCDVQAGALIFRAVGSDDPPARRIEMPRTRPLLLALRSLDSGSSFSRLLPIELNHPIDVPAQWRHLEMRTLAGDVYQLRREAAPKRPAAVAPEKKTCFVIQGFGSKQDYISGRTLDLDASYAVIKQAVEAAGLDCIRADEIVHSGTIDVPMYEHLLTADLVIADLSTSNFNAAFELGIRYALRPQATIVVAEEGFKHQFDVSRIVILRYQHLGEDLGMKEARRFQTALQATIDGLFANPQVDSPVYTFLPGLLPPRLEDPASAAFPSTTPTSPVPRAPPVDCFVVQAFGQKQDYISGRTLDLNASYAVIKDAVESAGHRCIRADEIVHSGSIDLPMYEHLLRADIVIADVSTYNPNPAFELGIRYGLRPQGTIVLAEEGFKNQWDVSHITMLRYRHLGEDLGIRDARTLRDLLQRTIADILADPKPDSPVYTLLPNLQPPRESGVERRPSPPATGERGQSDKDVLDAALGMINPPTGKASDFAGAKALLQTLLRKRPNDTFVAQQLAFATYKARLPDARTALLEAKSILLQLDPETTNDTQTLSLWGGVHKNLWALYSNDADLETSISAYRRCFELKHDYYSGVNCAYLLDLRALQAARKGDARGATADMAQARQVRENVLRDAALDPEQAAILGPDERYWYIASMWETCAALDRLEEAAAWEGQARSLMPAEWMHESTLSQIERIRQTRDEIGKALREPPTAA